MHNLFRVKKNNAVSIIRCANYDKGITHKIAMAGEKPKEIEKKRNETKRKKNTNIHIGVVIEKR